MGLFSRKLKQWQGASFEMALRPWLSETIEARAEISPHGGYKHAWVRLQMRGQRMHAIWQGESLGYLDPSIPEHATTIELVRRERIQVATVCCFADEERGRDGWRAILTFGAHRFQPRPTFKLK
nr:hypothetical protein GCM10023233_27520 [Brevibacterium otitidis]